MQNRNLINVNVGILREKEYVWNQIDASDKYSIYHTKAWKALIEQIFRHEAQYALAERSREVVDLLPMFLIRKRFLGKKLVSTPYEGCSGGYLSSDVNVRKLLIRRILENAQELNVRYVEIRSKDQTQELNEAGFMEANPLLISEVPLRSVDENFMMLSVKHRRNVRSAAKNGITIQAASSIEEMKAFYEILYDHYKNLGVPFFGEKFFLGIWEKLIENGQASLLMARFGEEIIGGHLLFFSGKTLISKYAAFRREKKFSKLYASYALFWEGIEVGLQKGFENFNLGVTGEANTGLLDFKSRFGAETHPVHFYYYPIRGKIPDFAKYYGEYSLLKKAWRNMPRFLTSPIGQKVNEWIC